MFGSVIRFMCGHKLHGRTNSTSGSSACTLSAIEHSVTITTRFGLVLAHPVDHAGGRAGVVGFRQHVRRAFRMRDDLRFRARSRDTRRSSSPVKRSCTSQAPFQAMIFSLVCEATYFARYWSGRKITVSVPRLSTTCTRVRRRAADVDLRLHLGRGVDVDDHRHAREFLAQQPHVLAGDGGGERAAGAHVRDQHGLVGVQDLRGLGHEMHAALHDDVGVDLRRLARELERIADEVGDAVVDFRRLIIVRQDDGVALPLQLVDRLHIGREERPLDRRDDGLDALVEMRGLAADLLVPFERGHRQHAEPARGR